MLHVTMESVLHYEFGIPQTSLLPNVVTALNEIVQEQFPGLEAVAVHINASRPNPYESVTGMIMEYNPEYVLKAPDPFNYQWCGVLMAGRIMEPEEEEGELSEEHFRRCAPQLESSIFEHASKAATFGCCGEDPSFSEDAQSWEPELGNHGFVGIFREARDRHGGGVYDYWLVVRVAAPDKMGYEFYHEIQDNADKITIKEVNQSHHYRCLENIARRSAGRIFYKAAEIFGIEHLIMDAVTDGNATVPVHDNQSYQLQVRQGIKMARPLMLFPPIINEYNCLRTETLPSFVDEEGNVVPQREKTYYYSHCTPTVTAKGALLFMMGPEHGMWIIRPNAPPPNRIGLCINNAGNSFPIGMPRVLNPETRKIRRDPFVWEGKDKNVKHPKLGGIYRRFDDEIDGKALEELTGVDPFKTCIDIVPVMVRLSVPVNVFD